MRNTENTRHSDKGFTLLEMMVVVMIIGLLAAMVVPNLLRNKERANQKKAVADIVALESSLDLYHLEHNRYPDNEQGLAILSTDGYVRRIPQDPWGRDYIYASPGKHGKIDVYTQGEDGKEGGEGAAADIGNWNIEHF